MVMFKFKMIEYGKVSQEEIIDKAKNDLDNYLKQYYSCSFNYDEIVISSMYHTYGISTVFMDFKYTIDDKEYQRLKLLDELPIQSRDELSLFDKQPPYIEYEIDEG